MMPLVGLRDRPRRVDELDVRQGLREVAEQLAVADVDLLREKPDVVPSRVTRSNSSRAPSTSPSSGRQWESQ